MRVYTRGPDERKKGPMVMRAGEGKKRPIQFSGYGGWWERAAMQRVGGEIRRKTWSLCQRVCVCVCACAWLLLLCSRVACRIAGGGEGEEKGYVIHN